MTTLQIIQQMLADELSLDAASLDPVRPLNELGIDSLALIECMFKLEDAFGISVESEELKAGTLLEIATAIDRRVTETRLSVNSDAAVGRQGA